MGAICTKPNTNTVHNPQQYIPNQGLDLPQSQPVAFLDEIPSINTKYQDIFPINSIPI